MSSKAAQEGLEESEAVPLASLDWVVSDVCRGAVSEKWIRAGREQADSGRASGELKAHRPQRFQPPGVDSRAVGGGG